jgi:DNA ligase 1
MKGFADLLESLAFTPGRNAKLARIAAWLATTPDPDRGWGLAALTGGLKLPAVTPSLLRKLTEDRVDPELFRLSYDFVGDLAETIALIWPSQGAPLDLPLSRVVDDLRATAKPALPGLIAGWLDGLPPSQRLALIKLTTGGLRVGVSTRLAQRAVSMMEPDGAQLDPDAIAERWHGLAPPYPGLFAWALGGPPPAQSDPAPFRPLMLAHPVDAETLSSLNPAEFVAEWKWDGIRVQAVASGGVRRLYSRTGEDLSPAFPDLVAALTFDGALDGELLVRRDGAVGTFSDLQQRLNRKSVTRAQLTALPAMIRAYDLLVWQGRDLRAQPLTQRRAALEGAVAQMASDRIDLSPLVPVSDWAALDILRAAPPDAVIEGLMLKRIDSPYLPGRPRGPWWKWKRDPMVVDAVLLYAQRGHGKRSGYYSDFTFGVWDGGALVPVGKAYSGFTDAELLRLDKFVRANTTDRFGPVRALAPKLVVEVAFEGLNPSPRHKSGIAMRFPRINRIRWDKPAAEADARTVLVAMMGREPG